MSTVKALSLWQPWASLWLTERKVHETRHWPTSHRGWLIVHAVKKPIDFYVTRELERLCITEFGASWVRDLPRGALIGAVLITGCHPTTELVPLNATIGTGDDWVCGNFEAGRYGFRRSDYRRFDPVIPYRGLQGLFEVPVSMLPEYQR